MEVVTAQPKVNAKGTTRKSDSLTVLPYELLFLLVLDIECGAPHIMRRRNTREARKQQSNVRK